MGKSAYDGKERELVAVVCPTCGKRKHLVTHGQTRRIREHRDGSMRCPGSGSRPPGPARATV